VRQREGIRRMSWIGVAGVVRQLIGLFDRGGAILATAHDRFDRREFRIHVPRLRRHAREVCVVAGDPAQVPLVERHHMRPGEVPRAAGPGLSLWQPQTGGMLPGGVDDGGTHGEANPGTTRSGA